MSEVTSFKRKRNQKPNYLWIVWIILGVLLVLLFGWILADVYSKPTVEQIEREVQL